MIKPVGQPEYRNGQNIVTVTPNSVQSLLACIGLPSKLYNSYKLFNFQPLNKFTPHGLKMPHVCSEPSAQTMMCCVAFDRLVQSCHCRTTLHNLKVHSTYYSPTWL